MYKRYFHLIIGLVLYAFGIVFTINANLGLAPWDAFHVGLSQTIGLSLGQISMIVGLAILFITYFLYESIGIGTILNIFIIGILIDVIFYFKLTPISSSIVTGLIMLIVGMFLIALGSYFYIGSSFGTGPRDGLMVALAREKNKPIGLVRGLIELSVLILGYLLGAKIGIGTVIIAFGMGPVIHLTFKVLHFDVSAVTHTSFAQRKRTYAPSEA